MRRRTFVWQPSMLTVIAREEAGSVQARDAVLSRKGKRRLRVLPPAGGPIPYGAILSSLWRSLASSSAACVPSDGLVQRLSQYTGLRYWVLTESGRSALALVLMALHAERPDCDEVIIPAYTSYSVPAAVVRAGLKVTLCDVEPESLGLDTKALAPLLSRRTLCIVPHHLFGLPCRIAEICAMAVAAGIPVIEDVAQGLGISYGNRKAGTFGTAAIFSASRGKNIPAAGGGLIGLSHKDLADGCRRMLQTESPRGVAAGLSGAMEAGLMAWFIRPAYYWLPASLPFLALGASTFDPTFTIRPMTWFQQALFTELFPNVDRLRQGRRQNAHRLRDSLQSTHVEVLWPREQESGAYLRLPVLFATQEAKVRALAELSRRGLGATEGYPLPLSQVSAVQPFLADRNQSTPVADRISRTLVTLPTHAWLASEDIEEITEVVAQCRS